MARMIDNKTFARYAKDPSAFRADLRVDVSGSVAEFGKVMDDWQRDDFAALDPALLLCTGRSKAPAQTRTYLERPRGHSKTTDLAVLCTWALAFAARPIRGYAFAADEDQAKLLKDAVETILRLNTWLSTILSVQQKTVLNIADGHPGSGSRLSISASDVASSYGILPDLIVADELTHWAGDGSLWHSLLSSAAKRKNCMLAVISNAGFADSWQWTVREAARTDATWYFSRLDGPQASWLSKERLAEQERMLPAVAYNRLWLNQWSSGAGDALSSDDIEAAFHDDLRPMSGTEQGYLFVAGLDLGLTRDCSALVVLGVPEGGLSGRLRLAQHKLWRPASGKKIDLNEIETYILALDERFGLEYVAFDPWQMEHLAQRLEADSGHRRRNQRRRFYSQPWMREVPPTAANLRSQASLLIESFGDHRFLFYPCSPLKQDLLKLRVEEKSYGFRLLSPRDSEGHGDTASAFALALLVAHEVAGQRPVVVGNIAESNSTESALERAYARMDAVAADIRNQEERLARTGNRLETAQALVQQVPGYLKRFL